MKFETSNYNSGEYSIFSERITTLFEITWGNNPALSEHLSSSKYF
jgi:hypothetical protein